MFRKNKDHEQERLFSPVKDLPAGPKKKLQNHWSTHFYEHFFTNIDEEPFAVLYDDGYSRPNKPVNELVALEVIKHLRGLSDKELEHAYLFDITVRNALGKEMLDDNISPNTFTNFRRRLVEFEEKTGRNLLQEVFEHHRDYLMDELDIDGDTQRMDSTFIDANIKKLSRIDLVAKVVHNFLNDLPADILEVLPEDLQAFAAKENLHLSYQLQEGEVEDQLDALVDQAALLVDQFEENENVTDLQSFDHLQRVLDEQCYRIPELEEEEFTRREELDDNDDDDSGWEPVRSSTVGHPEADSDSDEASDREEPSNGVPQDDASDDPDEQDDDSAADGPSAADVQLKDSDDISSDSLQNPNDPDATFRRKNGESHQGYKAHVAETCGDDDSPRIITDVQVASNNTADTAFLDAAVKELAEETDLRDLLTDGGYAGEESEQKATDHGVTHHLSGIKGRQVEEGAASLAAAEFDGREMEACPQGYKPYVQEYTEENDRYWGRMPKPICANCPYSDECFVEEKQDFFSYGFYGRELEVARHRAKLSDPEMEDFLNLRAGAESTINELIRKTGTQTRFTGTKKVRNSAVAAAIGTNLKRVASFLTAPGSGEQPTASTG